MKEWEDFENQCNDYLNSQFGKFAEFLHMGGSDSTISDIKVKTKNKAEFFIETKHSPAQCGQFVLLPNLKTMSFDYSEKNITPLNSYSSEIIKFMNGDFEGFKEAETTGKQIEMSNSEQVFANWIIETYKHKNVKFFITNGNTIIPLNKIHDYFDITAKYRVKRSGSSDVGKIRINSVMQYIGNNYIVNGYFKEGDKLFVSSYYSLHNKRFILNGTEYMFSMRDDRYEIRKLSNTFNANVIFSISLKDGVKGLTNEEFIDYLMH